MKKQSGLTLIEVILAIALLGIISVSLLTVFSSQLRNIKIGAGITEGAFTDQGIIEEYIYTVKNKIQKNESLDDLSFVSTVTNVEIFGETVEVHKVNYESNDNSSRNLTVYLSSMVASKESSQKLTVENVMIEVSNDPNNLVADLTTAPKLTAVHSSNASQEGFYTNLYRWWKTQPGVDPSNMKFPDDYVLISVAQDETELTDLLDNVGANSYVLLTVTPVDVNGNRGQTAISGNKVYVQGAEWRIESLPWVDIDNDYQFNSTKDYRLAKESVTNKLDAQKPYPNPSNPSVNLNLKDGSLFVPMGIAPSNITEPGNMAIEVGGTSQVQWLIERNINLAKDFNVINGSDISLTSGLGPNGGNIFVHPYVRLDSEGKIIVSGGVPELLNSGVTMNTTGNIRFETAGRGSIQLYNRAELIGNNISLLARGAIGISNSTLRSSSDVTINNNLDTFIQGSRKVSLLETNFEGITAGSTIDLNSPEEVYFKGGSWSSNQKVIIPNGKSIYFEKGNNRVNNFGLLDLGNTASVRFKTSMITDISNQLRIRATKKSNNEFKLIPHNYYRNISYSSAANNIVFDGSNIWKNIGGSNSNVEFSTAVVSGNGRVNDIKYSFDGTDSIKIHPNSTTATNTTRVRLEFRDKYSNREIKGIGFFSYSIDGNGNMTIIVEEEVPIDTYTITFDSNGGTPVSDIKTEYGAPITLPVEPTRPGYTFGGWEPSLPAYMPSNNLSTKAIWIPNTYKVTLDTQGGEPAEVVKDVVYGKPYGAVATPMKTGYNFIGWYTARNGGEQVDLTKNYMIVGDSKLYAQWSIATYTITFDSNGGSNPNPTSLTVTYGGTYGELPVVTKTGYSFEGWYTSTVGGELIGENTQVKTTNLTLYARWESQKVVVTFEYNGGTPNNKKTITVTVGEKYGDLPTPTKRGSFGTQQLEGWYTDLNDANSKVTSNSIVRISNNHTLYANYEGGCPFIYSFDGVEYHFEHEPVPYSINKAFESTTFGTLRELKEVDNQYQIRVAEYLESETYVNGVNLYTVDYKSDNPSSEVFVDIFGKPHIVNERQYPDSFVDTFGVNWVNRLKDKNRVVKSPSYLYEDGIPVVDYTAKFKIPKDAGPTAKLMVKTKVTDFFTSIGKWIHDSVDGENNIWWVQELMGLSSDTLVDAIDIMSLEVELWDGTKWIQQGSIEGGYHLLEEFLVPINLSQIDTKSSELKLRLRSGSGFFEIDKVTIDFTESVAVKVTKLTPQSVFTNNGLDVLKIVSDFEDDNRVKLQKGDYVDLFYDIPKLKRGHKRGFFVEFKGHFTSGVESRTNKISEMWNQKTSPEEIIAAVMAAQPESVETLPVVEMLLGLANELSDKPLEYKIQRIMSDYVIPWLNQ